MKKVNSISEFSDQRSKSLLENFRRSIATQSKISAKRAFHEAAEAPAPRFWVSEARAAAVMYKMLAGEDPTEAMLPEKREMYREIYRRLLVLKEKEPHEPVSELVFKIVNSEAPRSYMSAAHAKVLINKERFRGK